MGSHGGISSAALLRQQSRYSFKVHDEPLDTAHPQSSLRPHTATPPGFCHFIENPADAQRFTLNRELFDPADRERWKVAEKQMTKLGHLIRFNPDANKGIPNSNLPSGYTYLLQLVAHDLVHSSLSTSLGEGQVFGLGNLRDAPLRLETVYGGGPTGCPHAYQADPAGIFRTKLRLGRSRLDGDDAEHQGEEKDIARGTTGTLKELENKQSYPDALIADPRNDTHAIISQLVVLFHQLHNTIVDEVTRGKHLRANGNPFADAQRLFAAARLACTLIYRRLIHDDLLPRILHPKVREFYEGPDDNSFPTISQHGWKAPLEFTNGFFRFAHSMIRPSYRFNSSAAENFRIEGILKRTSEKSPSDVPFEKLWLVDWDRFFSTDDQRGNVSVRIGPWSQVGIGEDVPGEGNLIVRDLLSSIAVQPWAVGPLIDRLRETHASLLEQSDFLTSKDDSSNSRPWAGRISAWLTERTNATHESVRLGPSEIEALANDPPIPFFVRFEAGRVSGDAGERLGILGSIVVADVIYGILKQDRFIGKAPRDGLQKQLAHLSSVILTEEEGRDTNIFAFLLDIEDTERKIKFPSVLQFLRSHTNGNATTDHST